MKVLGIDPGTLFVGYALLEKQKRIPNLTKAGCLKLKKLDSIQERLLNIYAFLKDFVSEESPTHIALETPFYGKNAQSFLKLGYVRSIIYLIAQQNNLPLFEYSPSFIKKCITGSGSSTKEHVSVSLCRMFPSLQISAHMGIRHDITDAIAVGVTGIWSN